MRNRRHFGRVSYSDSHVWFIGSLVVAVGLTLVKQTSHVHSGCQNTFPNVYSRRCHETQYRRFLIVEHLITTEGTADPKSSCKHLLDSTDQNSLAFSETISIGLCNPIHCIIELSIEASRACHGDDVNCLVHSMKLQYSFTVA